MPEGKEDKQEIENLGEGTRHTSKSKKLRESQRSWIQGETHQDTS